MVVVGTLHTTNLRGASSSSRQYQNPITNGSKIRIRLESATIAVSRQSGLKGVDEDTRWMRGAVQGAC
jgi:hypothetical protein